MDKAEEYQKLDKLDALLDEYYKTQRGLDGCYKMKNQSYVINIEQLNNQMDVQIGIYINKLEYIKNEILNL